MIYLDTSAALKALVDEPQTTAVRALFDDDADLISSRLLAVEMHAVVDRRRLSATNAREVLDRVALVRIDDDIAGRAIDLRSGLRALDALHLATALSLGPSVDSVLSFDSELSAAALRYGIPMYAL